jgi:hypothetical protein
VTGVPAMLRLAVGSTLPAPSSTCRPGLPLSVHSAPPAFASETAPASAPVAPCHPAIALRSAAAHARGVGEGSAVIALAVAAGLGVDGVAAAG